MFIYYNQNVESDLIEFIEYLIEIFPGYMKEPKRLWNILKLFKGDREGIITTVVEQDYVDKQYRDSYYNYFAQKYSNYERNSVRLAFFQGHIEHDKFYPKDRIEKQLIGSIVLRPLNIGNIGHTLLNPHKLKVKGFGAKKQ